MGEEVADRFEDRHVVRRPLDVRHAHLPARRGVHVNLEAIAELPPGMRLIAMGPGGVQENAIELVGFEELCFGLADEEDWAAEVFHQVGSRLLAFYQRIVDHPAIGAVIVGIAGWRSVVLVPPVAGGPNVRWLVLPPGFASTATPNQESPVFDAAPAPGRAGGSTSRSTRPSP